MTHRISRRGFLKSTGILGAGAALGATRLGMFRALAQDAITLQWWDHFLPLQPLIEGVFAAYSAQNPNVTVEHTVYSPPDLGQALQLAFPNNQAPDVFANAGLSLPMPALHAEGWFAPLEPHVSEEWLSRLPPGIFIEGNTVFDGVLYSFPIFSFRFHEVLNWFNKQMMEDAGYDPENGPATWDEFRDAARKITDNGGGLTFGWIQGIGHIERMADSLNSLAQVAGASGPIDLTTGEYAYGSDPYVNALEFLVSMAQDGTLFPTSTTIDTRNARARWATDAGGMFFDGPWNIGVLQSNFADFMDAVSVTAPPTPEAGMTAYVNRGPKVGDFWISSQSEHPELAAAILQEFISDEFQVGLAERMDQPPLDSTAVSRANVHPTYAKSIEIFDQQVRLAPSPSVRNPAVTEVLARMTDVRPNLGEILQGAISGDVTDIRATLQDYADKMSAARETAIAAAQEAGFEVSQDDWVFDNWEPGQDYTTEFYQ